MEPKYNSERVQLRQILADDKADLNVFNALILAAKEQANINQRALLKDTLAINQPSDKTLQIILKTALLYHKKTMSMFWRMSVAALFLAITYSSFWYYTKVQNNELLLAEANFVEDVYQIHDDYNNIMITESTYSEQTSFEELDELSGNINSIIND